MIQRHKKIFYFIFIFTWMACFPICGSAVSDKNLNFKTIVGKWVRPDGGYIIDVRDVQPDGTTEVGYLNPNPIHVEKTEVSRWKGLIKLFIKLQDKGYPGSTYTLCYYPDKDALAGVYYQAAMDQTYKVVFIRKKE